MQRNYVSGFFRKKAEMLSCPTILYHTHVANGILDLVLINNASESLVHDLHVSSSNGLSDHNAIFFNLNVKAEVKPTKVAVTTRNLALLDLEIFQQLIKEPLSYDNLEQLSLNECIEMYNSTIEQSLNELAPVVETMIKPRPNQPWFNSELKSLKRKKRRAEKKFKSCNSQANLEKLNEQRRIYFSTLKSARIEYNAKVISLSCRDNPKAFYHHVQRLSGDIPPAILPSKYSIAELPDKFADYFETKVCDIRSNFCAVSQQNQILCDTSGQDRTNSSIPSMSEFHDVMVDNFNLVVSKLTNKNYIFDPAPVRLIKSCAATTFPVLHYILTRSFDEGVFPDDLKHATVTPIIKNNNLDPDDFKSYRPISNTPYLAKVLEKAAHFQINDHLMNNQLYCPNQSGYKQNHSCETALTGIVNDIQETIYRNNLAAVLMLDLSAAFDTVDHCRLISKLRDNFNIAGKVLSWLKSYLENRTSSVVLKGKHSVKKRVMFGVPQGSILGPLLFILYVNELNSVGDEFGLTVHSYADDTTLYIGFDPSSDSDNACHSIKCCLLKIEHWMNENFLKLNIDKSQLLMCGKTRLIKVYQSQVMQLKSALHINCDPMETSKILGVLLDSRLCFSDMVNETCRVCYFKLSKLKNLRHFLSQDIKIMLVKCFIISKLDYCNCLYSCCPQYLVNKLQKVLNACIRYIFNVPLYDPTTLLPLYKQCHILPFHYRIQFKLCLMVFKILNNLSPVYLRELFKIYVPSRENLRSASDSNKILTDHCFDKTISYKMCDAWNVLPLRLRISNSLTTFKKELKSYFFELAFCN